MRNAQNLRCEFPGAIAKQTGQNELANSTQPFTPRTFRLQKITIVATTDDEEAGGMVVTIP